MSLRAIVLTWSESGGAYTNQTFQTGYTALTTANDKVYLGFDRRFDALLITLSTNGSLTGVAVKYWNGTAWTEFGCAYAFAGTDFVRWNLRADVSDWERYAFTSISPHAGTPPDTKDRYWLQISCTAVTTAPVVTSIQVSPYTQYTTAKAVSEFLQQSTGKEFSLDTHPNEQTVEDIIRRQESSLEKITRKSWRLSEATEYREFNYAGLKVSHAPIVRLESVKLWQGTSWRTLQQGRTGETYAVNDIGMVFFTRFFVPVFVPYSGGGAVMPYIFLYMLRYPIEISYWYGADFETHEESGMVEDTTILMTSVRLLQQYEKSVLTKAGVDRIEMSARVRQWKEEIEDNLKSLARGITVW